MLPTLSRRTALVFGLVCLTIISAFLLESFLSTNPSWPFGHTPMAHLIGWMGLGFIGLTFGYPLKRWGYPSGLAQTLVPKSYPVRHLRPTDYLCSCGGHIHAWMRILALVAMFLVVMSGIVGQALHYWAFRMLYERRHQLCESIRSSKKEKVRIGSEIFPNVLTVIVVDK